MKLHLLLAVIYEPSQCCRATSCSYFLCFLFINSSIKHGPQVCEVEDGQKAEDQVEHHHPNLLQTETRVKPNILDGVVYLTAEERR